MSKELVAVIITTYKRPPEMVIRSLKSVLNQTYSALEVIVVDDSPKEFELRDDVRKSIEEIGDIRVTYLSNEKNIGACASRNRGIRLSKAQYVMYVDDDDELIAECVEKRLNKFFENPTAGLIYSDCYIMDDVSGTCRRMNQKKYKGYVFDKLIIGNFVHAFPLMKRECFETCGMFDEELLSLQDYDMWLRISEKYEFDYVDEPLSVVHMHSGERITTNLHKKIQGFECLNEKNKEYLQKNKYAYHIRLIKIAPHYIAAGRFKDGFIALFKGIFVRPFDFAENLRYTKRCFLEILECNKNKRLSK